MALEGLEKQEGIEGRDFEILVIDNNSTDHPEEIVAQFQHLPHIHFYNESKQGLGHVRNTGYLLAQGAYVAYLDDDAIPTPNWLAQLFQIITVHASDCICGPIHPYYTDEKPDWFKDSYEVRTKGDDPKWLKPGEEASGSNMVWKKEVIANLGGINTALGMRGDALAAGEDTDLFSRYWQYYPDGKIYYHPALVVKHWTPAYKMKVSYYLKRQYVAGQVASILRRSDPLWRKVLKSIQVFFEMLLVLLVLFPFSFWKYDHKENWYIEQLHRVTFRLGWLLTNVGIRLDINRF